MTDEPLPGAASRVDPSAIGKLGSRQKWATLLFLLTAIAVFGLAWVLGYVHFD